MHGGAISLWTRSGKARPNRPAASQGLPEGGPITTPPYNAPTVGGAFPVAANLAPVREVPVVRKYSIKLLRVRANIRGASHRGPISRGQAHPSPSDGGVLASGWFHASPGDPAHQVPARYADVRRCNVSPNI